MIHNDLFDTTWLRVMYLGHLSLPPELEQDIIRYLCDDPSSLCACALVCSAWVPLCRKLLYHNVTITTEAQFKAFVWTVQSQPCIRRLVQVLRLDASTRKYRSPVNWVIEGLCHLPPNGLENLYTLEFIKVDDNWLRPSIYTALAQWRSVKKLSIISCTMSSAEFFFLINAFPQIEVLFVNDYEEDRTLGRPTFKEHPLLHLTCLTRLFIHSSIIPRYDFFGRDTVFDWILRSPARDTIRELYIGLSRRSFLNRTRFVTELGPNLRRLAIAFAANYGENPDDIPTIHANFTLSYNTELRCLTLPYPSRLLGLSLISQVNAPKLERLNLHLELPYSFTLRKLHEQSHVEWDNGLVSLLETNLRSLLKISIFYDGEFPIEFVRQRLAQLLPKVQAKVKVEVIPSPELRHWF